MVLMSERRRVSLALALTLFKATTDNMDNKAIMAITTNNSMIVKAFLNFLINNNNLFLNNLRLNVATCFLKRKNIYFFLKLKNALIVLYLNYFTIIVYNNLKWFNSST